MTDFSRRAVLASGLVASAAPAFAVGFLAALSFVGAFLAGAALAAGALLAGALAALVFAAVVFPYLFVIPLLAHRGYSMMALLALPVLGGGIMTAWSAHCRRELGLVAEQIEAGAARYDREIAFTQSYWASMRRPSEPWAGPLPDAAR